MYLRQDSWLFFLSWFQPITTWLYHLTQQTAEVDLNGLTYERIRSSKTPQPSSCIIKVVKAASSTVLQYCSSDIFILYFSFFFEKHLPHLVHDLPERNGVVLLHILHSSHSFSCQFVLLIKIWPENKLRSVYKTRCIVRLYHPTV